MWRWIEVSLLVSARLLFWMALHLWVALRLVFLFWPLALWDRVTRFEQRRKRLPRLVVVGGGFAGAYVANSLQREFQVTLIDTKPYFEFTPSVLRTVVQPSLLPSLRIPHSRYLRGATVSCDTVSSPCSSPSFSSSSSYTAPSPTPTTMTRTTPPTDYTTSRERGDEGEDDFSSNSGAPLIHIGTVTEVRSNPNEVITSTGQTFPYDYLALCTGTCYKALWQGVGIFSAGSGEGLVGRNAPVDLARAQDVLIVGGGLVGVELAAEILHHFEEYQQQEEKKQKQLQRQEEGKRQQRQVTIAQRGALLGRMDEKASKYATAYLEEKGVKWLHEGIQSNPTVGEFVTTEGKRVKADVTFCCVGGTPNSFFLRSSCALSVRLEGEKEAREGRQRDNFKDRLKGKGWIRVNEYLQLEGEDRIFVAGDVTAVDEEKLAQSCEKAAAVVVHNLRRLMKQDREQLKNTKMNMMPAMNETTCVKVKEGRVTERCGGGGGYLATLKEKGELDQREWRTGWAKYQPRPRIMVVSLGPYRGIVQWGAWSWCGFLPALLKEVVEWKWRFQYA